MELQREILNYFIIYDKNSNVQLLYMVLGALKVDYKFKENKEETVRKLINVIIRNVVRTDETMIDNLEAVKIILMPNRYYSYGSNIELKEQRLFTLGKFLDSYYNIDLDNLVILDGIVKETEIFQSDDETETKSMILIGIVSAIVNNEELTSSQLNLFVDCLSNFEYMKKNVSEEFSSPVFRRASPTISSILRRSQPNSL